MQIIGLTGSIAMGKSYTAKMFKRFGLPVFDSDAAVHALFGPGQAIACAIEAAFGDVLDENGGVDRQRLGAKVLKDNGQLFKLESIVHPAVYQAQKQFLQQACRQGFNRALLDIPLLFEGGHRQRFDAVVVVACAPALQRERAMTRPGMTEAKFTAILAKQLPIDEKIRRADRVITSGFDRGHTHSQVTKTLDWLDQQHTQAWPRHWH